MNSRSQENLGHGTFQEAYAEVRACFGLAHAYMAYRLGRMSKVGPLKPRHHSESSCIVLPQSTYLYSTFDPPKRREGGFVYILFDKKLAGQHSPGQFTAHWTKNILN